MTRRVFLCGSSEELAAETDLRAGPLVLTFSAGEVRHVRLANREVVRRIYFAVRDPNWRTVPPRLLSLWKRVEKDSFRIQLELENKQGAIDFQWSACISGDSDGTLRFAVHGWARSSFLKNRIGLCVLHPIRECAGRSCTVEATNGALRQASFPAFISPYQVFRNVRAISHEVEDGVRAEVRFEGEVFETEDQRNWCDASYKTYCPPLDRRYPNEIRAGEVIAQSVTLKLLGPKRFAPVEHRRTLEVRVDPEKSFPLPAIGLGRSSAYASLDETATRRLRCLKLSHLRTDVVLGCSGWEMQLQRAAEEAAALECKLEVALFLSLHPECDLQSVRSSVERIKPPVCRWLIFQQGQKCTDLKWVQGARDELHSVSPAKFGGGTDNYFAELNRCKTFGAEVDVISVSLNPQVHGYDHVNVAENLEAQGELVRTAHHLWPGVPVALSPITLRPRFNPDATCPDAAGNEEDFPFEVDVRQMSLFAAGWTLGSLKYVSESGAQSATYYETVGWRGVLESSAGPASPKFPSFPNAVFPLYHVFADFADFAEGRVLRSESSSPRQVEAVALQKKGMCRLLIANLDQNSHKVDVRPGGRHSQCYLTLLDESNVECAMREPECFRAGYRKALPMRNQEVEIELPPFAVARLDCD